MQFVNHERTHVSLLVSARVQCSRVIPVQLGEWSLLFFIFSDFKINLINVKKHVIWLLVTWIASDWDFALVIVKSFFTLYAMHNWLVSLCFYRKVLLDKLLGIALLVTHLSWNWSLFEFIVTVILIYNLFHRVWLTFWDSWTANVIITLPIQIIWANWTQWTECTY